MLCVLGEVLLMSNHNTDFCGEIRKDINTFWLKKCQVWSYETHLSILRALGKTRFWRKHLPVMFFCAKMAPDFFFLGFYDPFKNISPVSSRPFIKGGRKLENPGKNHLTIRKQNLAFPHVT